MINGNPNEFIDGLYYGDERFFLYKGKKYFIQGYKEKFEKPLIEVCEIECDDGMYWKVYSDKDDAYPVQKFEKAKIFDGKSFWEI